MPDEPVTTVSDDAPNQDDLVRARSAAPDDPQKTKYENSLRREPYEWARCTVTLTLQLLPDDGDDSGRPVLIGVQDHAFPPALRLARLGELALPPLLTQLVDEHAERMGEREQAYRQELERLQKAVMPATPRKTAKKPRLADLPVPTPPAVPAVPAPATNDKPQQGTLF